jgi:hypothetical protein
MSAVTDKASRSDQVRDLFNSMTPFPAALVFISYEDEDNGAFGGLCAPLDGDWSWIHHQVEGGWLMEMVRDADADAEQ